MSENIRNLNVNDYYSSMLEGKELTIPDKKGWKLIKDRNKGREDNIALSEDDLKISYGQMFENWDSYAKAFSALSMTKDSDSRILVIMPNVASTCYIDYASNMTGAVCSFIDPTSSSDKIINYVKNEKITDVISLDLLYEQNVRKINDELRNCGVKNIVLCHEPFMNHKMPFAIRGFGGIMHKVNKFEKNIYRMDDVLRNCIYQQISYDNSDPASMSLITHTSGTTTGVGKPIPISDINRNALVIQHDLAELNFNSGMTMLHFIPYFAAYGAVNTVHLGLSKGMELQQIPVFTPKKFGEILIDKKPQIVLSIFSAWLSLIDDPRLKNADLSFLEVAVSGGSPVNSSDEQRINDFLASHGCKVKLTKGYGLSELCGCGAYTIDGYNTLGSMGVIMPLSSLKIKNLESGEIIDPYKKSITGEAFISSPTLTSGILDGKVVVPTVDIEGKKYLPTKDIIEVSETGSLKFKERKDRMFSRYDGYNVYPLQIENMLKSIPNIKNCVIVSEFDENKKGNVPKIYVELSQPEYDKESFIKKIIMSYFLNNSSKVDGERYKANFRDIPVHWVFIDQIPRNTMGKEDFNLLRNGLSSEDSYYVHVEEDNMFVSSIDISKDYDCENQKILKK